MSIDRIQDEVIEEFALFDNPQDQYSYIIEIGKNAPAIAESDRLEENMVKGCQSSVWLTAAFDGETVVFRADSDSTLVKGLVNLLVRVFSGQTPESILAADPYFIEKIGLKHLLSMNRSNGLASMLKQIKFYALAFSSQQKQNATR